MADALGLRGAAIIGREWVKTEHTVGALARIIAATICLLVILAYCIDVVRGEGTAFENAAGLLRFFTIWGNVAAAIIMGRIALGGKASAPVMAALVTALTIIALVYWGVLAGDHQPEGAGLLTNHIFHTVSPALTIGWWFAFGPQSVRLAKLVPAIMVPPLSYGAFAFVLGEVTGFYAYFFLDLPTLGWGSFLANNAGLALFFAAVGVGLLTVKRMVDLRR